MTTNIEHSTFKSYTIECLINRWSDDGKTATMIAEHWASAPTQDAFVTAVLSDERLTLTKAFAELSKEVDGHWYRVRQMFGEKCFKTDSDAGSVKVGNGAFSTLINNGAGDGTTRVAVFAKGDAFNADMMAYAGITLDGNFSIYDYDCGGDPIVALDGKYSVYRYDGLVAFAEV